MALIDRIKEQAKAKKTRIVFPEGNEPRIIRGVDIVQSQGIADCVILGKEADIRALAPEAKLEGVTFIDPVQSDKTASYAETFYELRKKKGMTPEKAAETMLNTMYYGTMMVHMGDADGMVAGAICSTADTLRPAPLWKAKPSKKQLQLLSCFGLFSRKKASFSKASRRSASFCVPAAVSARTREAPADKSAFAQVRIVAPVVRTSSIKSTGRPLIRSAARSFTRQLSVRFSFLLFASNPV